jgi:hypothetical protein
MICNKCGVDCSGFPTGDPAEDICSECAFPMLKLASESAIKSVEAFYLEKTGQHKSGNEILRQSLGF